jgi:hypothetical protein
MGTNTKKLSHCKRIWSEVFHEEDTRESARQVNYKIKSQKTVIYMEKLKAIFIWL